MACISSKCTVRAKWCGRANVCFVFPRRRRGRVCGMAGRGGSQPVFVSVCVCVCVVCGVGGRRESLHAVETRLTHVPRRCGAVGHYRVTKEVLDGVERRKRACTCGLWRRGMRRNPKCIFYFDRIFCHGIDANTRKTRMHGGFRKCFSGNISGKDW